MTKIHGKTPEPQSLGPNPETCCILWTGGKDCNLALLKCWRDPNLEVTHLVVFTGTSGTFKAHPIGLMKAQAKSLGLPLLIKELSSEISYQEAYLGAIRELQTHIRVIATGDMDVVGDSQDNFIETCCNKVGGIRAYLPLWKANREDCLVQLLFENDCKIVFSCVKSPWFDDSWCGRILDKVALEEMMAKISSFTEEPEHDTWSPKDPRRIPLDLGGENGEYHTMVLDGPLYQREIPLVRSPHGDLRADVTGPAKDGEDRWWTYEGQTCWSLGEKFRVEPE